MNKLLTETVSTNWYLLLQNVLSKNNKYVQCLEKMLENERECFAGLQDIYPPENKIFNTFNFFPVEELKVVILGQDPYHQPNQAMGMCFSVPDSIRIPPSLRNIYKEIKGNFESYEIPQTGDLTNWNKQGILLLNTSLTVRQSTPNSHSKYWKDITNSIIEEISINTNNTIFLLWGNHAISKKKYIDCDKHYVLISKHPSPLSANRGGWFGGNHFKKTNEYLVKLNKEPITW